MAAERWEDDMAVAEEEGGYWAQLGAGSAAARLVGL